MENELSTSTAEEFEETYTAKDREIAELKSRLAAQIRERDHSPTPNLDGWFNSRSAHTTVATQQARRAKAPQLRCFLERTQQSV